jgi:Icc-related predicted phosphoesterase
MKIISISDSHTYHRKLEIPDGDVLIHAGDITFKGEIDVLIDFNNWLGEQKSKFSHILCIAGNHDIIYETKNAYARSLITNATYLQDSSITIDGIKFYGSPWTPRFFDWAFNANRGTELRQIWNKIPNDTNVLITHGPAFGSLDEVPSGMHVGCSDLKDRIAELSDLKLHICGHIHHSYGIKAISNPIYVNAAVCTENYQAINKPIVVEI